MIDDDLIFRPLNEIIAEKMQNQEFATSYIQSQQRREILTALRKQREAQHLTLADMAERTGLKLQNISRLELDESSPTLDTLLTYINALSGSVKVQFSAQP